ncbi:hypothetical protein KCP74_00895 [Salmonella enterica subsp. enterica]|nr:hypothetical protein KCP74_00895 [Salmonella enterica subsp. enterica]
MWASWTRSGYGAARLGIWRRRVADGGLRRRTDRSVLHVSWPALAGGELIGMTLALSSRLSPYEAMNERNLTVSQVGRSAFAVLLFRISRRSRWWR